MRGAIDHRTDGGPEATEARSNPGTPGSLVQPAPHARALRGFSATAPAPAAPVQASTCAHNDHPDLGDGRGADAHPGHPRGGTGARRELAVQQEGDVAGVRGVAAHQAVGAELVDLAPPGGRLLGQIGRVVDVLGQWLLDAGQDRDEGLLFKAETKAPGKKKVKTEGLRQAIVSPSAPSGCATVSFAGVGKKTVGRCVVGLGVLVRVCGSAEADRSCARQESSGLTGMVLYCGKGYRRVDWYLGLCGKR